MGDDAIKDHNLKRALKCYRKAVKINPAFVEAWHKLAWAEYHRGFVKKGIKTLIQVDLLEPNSPEHLRTIGTWYLRLADRDNAVIWLRKSVEHDPGHASTWFMLGIAEKERNHLDEAVEAWKRGLDLEPQNFDAWREMGEIQEQRGDLREANRAYKRALKMDPNDSYLLRKIRDIRELRQRRT